MEENNITGKVIGIAIDLHKQLGPGLLESVYQHTLSYELLQAGLQVDQQVPIPLVHKAVKLDCGFRVDILVEKKVIIEVKSVEALAQVHFAQTLTYLKLSGYKVGLLINFNSVVLKDGIQRVVNNFVPNSQPEIPG
jgi:GxxExxY protein